MKSIKGTAFFLLSYLSMLLFLFILVVNSRLCASNNPAPYIPSYDDWYEDDLKQANANINYFKEPKDTVNYAHYHYIGAHSAEKYQRFSEYVMQEQPMLGVLSTGARG